MKRLILTILCLLLAVPCFAQEQLAMLQGVVGSGGSSIAYNAVDMVKGFNDNDLHTSTATDFVLTDSFSVINYHDNAQSYEGGYSLSTNLSGTARTSYITYDIGSSKSSINICFWFRGGEVTGVSSLTDTIFHYGPATPTAGDKVARIRYELASGVYSLNLMGVTNDAVTISINVWYRIELALIRNDTCTMKVYGTDGTLIDTATVTGDADVSQYVRFGAIIGSSASATYKYYVDAVAINYTTNDSDLWPYSISH